MSHLADHAAAADYLGDAFESQAGQSMRQQAAGGDANADRDLLLMSIAAAYRVAADNMRRDIAARANRMASGHACSIDHRALKAGKCPLCGAPKS